MGAAGHQLSQRRVARLIPIERMTLRYEHHRDRQEALRIRLRELAGSRVRYGYRRMTVLLKREGWEVNAKRIYRLYVEEGLIVRTKKRKERAQRQRIAQGFGDATEPEVVDGLRGPAVAGRALDQGADGGRSVHQGVRNAAGRQHAERREGGGCAGQGAAAARCAGIDYRGQRDGVHEQGVRSLGAYKNSVHLNFIRPGRPVENGYIESFNGKLRDECLNVEVFFSLADARCKLYLWRQDYNHHRPHSALADRTPASSPPPMPSAFGVPELAPEHEERHLSTHLLEALT